MAIEESLNGAVRGHDLAAVEAFFDQVDGSGMSNREKAAANRKVIRRVESTSKDVSYEESPEGESGQEAGPHAPFGAVMRDGKLIGFGIHIFNEDVYPLKSFEIYLRNCGLSGRLDLSGCADLAFVDVYHNDIAEIDVTGAVALRILGVQDNDIAELDCSTLAACQGIDAGRNRLARIDVTHNPELVELYVNDNAIAELDLAANPKLKYLYCHNNRISTLDTTANPLLRHLDVTGNPLKSIRCLAPQADEALPLTLAADGDGFIGLKFNPVYDAQWKETGEWQQSYHAYPAEHASFEGWYEDGALVSRDADWVDTYGTSRQLIARFHS